MKTTQSSFEMLVLPANIVPTRDQIFAALEKQILDIRERRDLSVEQADEIIEQLLYETAKNYCGSNKLEQKQFCSAFIDWVLWRVLRKELRPVMYCVLGTIIWRLICSTIFSKK